jgi:hypothetical protein
MSSRSYPYTTGDMDSLIKRMLPHGVGVYVAASGFNPTWRVMLNTKITSSGEISEAAMSGSSSMGKANILAAQVRKQLLELADEMEGQARELRSKAREHGVNPDLPRRVMKKPPKISGPQPVKFGPGMNETQDVTVVDGAKGLTPDMLAGPNMQQNINAWYQGEIQKALDGMREQINKAMYDNAEWKK